MELASPLIDYAARAAAQIDPVRTARLRRRRVRLLIAFLVGACGIGAWYGRFTSLSVCNGCGAEEITTEWQIPLTNVTYWRATHVNQTPLSTVLARTGMAPGHVHTWEYVHGSGNGIMCAIGSGRRIFTTLHYSEIANFVDAVARYQGPVPAGKWAAALLDDARTQEVSSMILNEDVPEGGFGSREQFQHWWRQHGQNLVTPQ